MDDYLALNRANWDDRAGLHAASPDYDVQRFVDDPDFLSGVVRFDLPRLGSVEGLRGVHLQCHIGTDTLSLRRLGARMTGLDLSPASIEQARSLAERTGIDIDYVVSPVYDALDVLEAGTFDLVYVSVGALVWLPDVTRWARVVSELLAPGGRLFIRDGHPMLQTLADPGEDEALVVDGPYFETVEPQVWDEPATYVTTDRPLQHTVTHSWNHGLGEIVTALLGAGLTVTALVEHDTAPWPALGALMEPMVDGEFRLRDRPERLPMTFTLQAVKQ